MKQATETKIPWGVIIMVSLTLLVVGGLLIAKSTTGNRRSASNLEPKIARYGMIEDFNLIDHQGQPFTRTNVEGKVWVANFIFTSCATECPVLSRRMREIQSAFATDPRVSLVSISVDPRTDSPERLNKYAQSFNAGPRWSFVTGEEQEVEILSTKGFLVNTPGSVAAASSAPRTRQLLHSQKLAVVDQLGVVRFYANGMNNQSSKQVINAVIKLLSSE